MDTLPSDKRNVWTLCAKRNLRATLTTSNPESWAVWLQVERSLPCWVSVIGSTAPPAAPGSLSEMQDFRSVTQPTESKSVFSHNPMRSDVIEAGERQLHVTLLGASEKNLHQRATLHRSQLHELKQGRGVRIWS